MAQGELLLLLVAHLVMTGLPRVAPALLLASRGERRTPVLLAVLLAASGATALIGFFAYYESRPVRQTCSFLLMFGSLLATGWLLWDRKIPREVLRRIATPLGLWMLGSAFLVFL